jgi:ATP-dependent DNA helicase RecG
LKEATINIADEVALPVPITVSTITHSQRDRILELEEGHFADLKAIDIAPAKLTKTIAAFANADGGELFIGIDEDKHTKQRSWRGFANPEAANAHIQVFEELFPLGQSFSYNFLQCPGEPGLVLQVAIQKTADIKVATDGKPYLRRSAQSLPVDTPEKLSRLKLTKGITSFETETVDVDPELITYSLPIINFILEVVPTTDPEPWLKKQQLLRNGKPTVAGLLLFAEEPQAVLPKRCAIKIYRYRTKEREGSRETLVFDPITVEGCVYDQIKAAVRKTVEIIEQVPALGDDGFRKVLYPEVTLHEIITNAVLHRDYSIADDVHVRIFDNRVEVESPGRLPGHVTKHNILRERASRNGTIVRLINKFPDPPNKDVGEGLNTAFAAMKQLRLKVPIIEELENSVLVNIRHEPLASPEDAVMEYLSTHDMITNSEARVVCAIASADSMKKVFDRLRKSGLIEPVPGRRGKASAWKKSLTAAK